MNRYRNDPPRPGPGDWVFLEGSEYKVLAMDEWTVTLFDSVFPRSPIVMALGRFMEKVKGDPMNEDYYSPKDLLVRHPIGRIDYLGSDGRVGERIEYDDPVTFEQDIRECTDCGVPMSITLYRDQGRKVIPYDFIFELDPPPKGFEIISVNHPLLDQAMDLIDEYCREEFQSDEGGDYSDLTRVNIGYTVTEDDKHEIQARVDLEGHKIETLVDDVVVRTKRYESLKDMVENALPCLDFGELTEVSAEEVRKSVNRHRSQRER